MNAVSANQASDSSRPGGLLGGGWRRLVSAWGWEGAVILLLACFGLLAIRNATLHQSGSLLLFYKQQCWLAMGILTCGLAAAVPARVYQRAAPWLGLGAWLFLWGVLYWGVRLHGHQYTMRGWYGWNTFFLQPSEFGKPAFALLMAWGLSRFAPRTPTVSSQPFRSWVFLAGILGFLSLWCLPITLQPDFGCILVHFLIFAIAYKYAGFSLARLGLAALPLAGLAGGFCLAKYPYLGTRFMAFLDPDSYAQREAWHQIQFQNTFAAGGLWGNRSLPEQWHSGYLPLGYSDSIFATVAESGGFFMALLIIIAFASLAWRGIRLAAAQDDLFRGIAIATLVGGVVSQAFVHIGVNTGLMPPTGLTLPFVSYGGSSLVSSFLSIGIVAALCRREPEDNPGGKP